MKTNKGIWKKSIKMEDCVNIQHSIAVSAIEVALSIPSLVFCIQTYKMTDHQIFVPFAESGDFTLCD